MELRMRDCSFDKANLEVNFTILKQKGSSILEEAL